MATSRFRIVLDTNTLLRGLLDPACAAARVLRAAEKRAVLPLLSKSVLDEYRAVLTDDEIVARYPQLTTRLVEVTIRRLRFIGDYVRAPATRFVYGRDPRDEKFLELAIALGATHVLSADKDLLSLPGGRTEASRRGFASGCPALK